MPTKKKNIIRKKKLPNTSTMKADISIAKKKNPNTRKKEQHLKKSLFAKGLLMLVTAKLLYLKKFLQKAK